VIRETGGERAPKGLSTEKGKYLPQFREGRNEGKKGTHPTGLVSMREMKGLHCQKTAGEDRIKFGKKKKVTIMKVLWGGRKEGETGWGSAKRIGNLTGNGGGEV